LSFEIEKLFSILFFVVLNSFVNIFVFFFIEGEFFILLFEVRFKINIFDDFLDCIEFLLFLAFFSEFLFSL